MRKGEIEGRFDATAYKKAFSFTSSKFPIEKLAKIAFIDPKLTFEKLDRDSEISFVPMEVISEHSGAIEELRTKKVSETKGFTRFQENDLIWAKITPCMQNGKSAVARNLQQGFGCGSTEFYVIRPKSKDISVDYLHFLLRDKKVLENAQNFFGGSAGQQRVSVDFLRGFQVPVPPIEVQTRIIEKFEAAYRAKREKETEAKSLLDGIDAYLLERLGIETPAATDTKKTFFTRASKLSGGRFDPSFYKPNFQDLVSSLEKKPYKRLREVVKFSSESWNQKDFFENTFPYIEISEIDLSKGEINNVNQFLITEAPSRAKMIVRNGDIIVSTTRPSRGAIARINENEDFSIASTGFAVIRSLNNDFIIKDYLHTVLRHRICLLQMEQRSSGGNYPAITIEELGNLLILLPPLAVQEEIAARVQAIRAQSKKLDGEAKRIIERAKQEVEQMILGADE